MSTLIQYNALTAMPNTAVAARIPVGAAAIAAAANAAAAALQTAKNEAETAKHGDRQRLPPPFTHGKIYINENSSTKILKLANAPALTSVELKALMMELPKQDTQLQLAAPPIGGIAVPVAPAAPTTFLEMARDTIRRRRQGKIWRKLGKELNARRINASTRQRRTQNDYKLLIELSTGDTGKHTIFYSTRMVQGSTAGPRTRSQNQQKN